MFVSGIDYESIVDGAGVRTVVFVSGCLHKCEGCHNLESHSFSNGVLFTEKLQDEVIWYINNTPYITGLTLSGGDPFYNAEEVLDFVKKYKRVCSKSIWIYSGFTLEEILKNETYKKLLVECDILVDGLFKIEEKGFNLVFKGSKNQNIVDIQKSIQNNKMILAKEGENF